VPSGLPTVPTVTGVAVNTPTPGVQRVTVHTPSVSAPAAHPRPVVALLDQLLTVLGLHR